MILLRHKSGFNIRQKVTTVLGTTLVSLSVVSGVANFVRKEHRPSGIRGGPVSFHLYLLKFLHQILAVVFYQVEDRLLEAVRIMPEVDLGRKYRGLSRKLWSPQHLIINLVAEKAERANVVAMSSDAVIELGNDWRILSLVA
ncbi:unnamed protein product [Clavelina lepadiformis]|uniref:Uncharacterized protein n=1 Tax=Clavelina lepadiformis TaxID=159417 RepID=A0ABP0GEU4_CLALP